MRFSPIPISIAALLLCISVGFITGDEGAASGPIVWTSCGLMQGIEMTSRDGRGIRAFRGIPYAAPPVGDLRFRAPEPAQPWSGVLNATENPPQCVQKNYFLPGSPVEGQEDCLYLNIYTPEYASNTSHSLPVMVFLHGGGWFTGSSSSLLYGPEYLLDAGVILVTLNYRLGALGFLSTGNDEAPGNWGLKDQVLALRWVQHNIASFGGNASNVTLFGQSAGAGAAHLHAISPVSAGLFQRVICMSGVSLGPWATPFEDPQERARKHAFYLGATSRQVRQWSSKQLMAFMREKDAYDITEADVKFRVWSVDPLTTYRPVVERRSEKNPNPFMTNTPLEMTRAAGPNVVPMLLGVTSNEGIVRAGDIYINKTLRDDFNKRIDHLGPFILELRQDAGSTWKDIKEFYFGRDAQIDRSSLQDFINLISDRAFIHSTAKAIRMHSRAGPKSSPPPIYLYNFDYEGIYSFAPIYAHSPEIKGATHSDDTVYIFSSRGIFPDWPKNHPDIVTSKLMVNIFTNFAKFGDPTPSNLDITWSPALDRDNQNSVRKQRLTYMDISNHKSSSEGVVNLRLLSGFYTNRNNFWDKLPLFENKYGV